MVLALGIDTGGTFTDSVIFDLTDDKVLVKAKAPTTYEDLTKGIRNSTNNLNFDKFDEIRLVSLSTTMATNAIVEGRGCEVGLILIGEEPIDSLPVKHYAVVRGGHDIQGNPKDELDLNQVELVLEVFKHKVEAVAVSGFASVRNPEHELRVKELVEQKLNVPVVCGHQLTTSLGFYERSVTAALNARLIPIITNLIDAVKKVLSEKGIDAPLMIVKGDGTLMSESVAIEKPIETILSGPAGSIIGATTLTNIPQALVLDMGGTTTDIAILKDSLPRINPKGATVGGWLTRVEAADITTFGLGGDSYLRADKNKKMVIGPQKVWPLSFVGAKYPYLVEELELQRKNRTKLKVSDAADAYILLREYYPEYLTETEKRALEILASGPRTLLYLAYAAGKIPLIFNLDRLVKMGIVAKVAVTPTDILHANGTFNEWNRDLAALGVQILSETMGRSPQEFLAHAFDEIVNGLCITILQSVLQVEGAPPELFSDLDANYLVRKFLMPGTDELLSATANLRISIIGIGAPVRAYLPAVARKLNCELIIPEHSDVANAIGAAAGKIMEKIKMTINPYADGYHLYSQWERKNFLDLDTAKRYAIDSAAAQAKLMAEKAGAYDYEISTNCHDVYAQGDVNTHLETVIEVTVTGTPTGKR